MVAKLNHLVLGATGEKVAANFLERKGFCIVVRNWRPHGAYSRLELDLVARQGNHLVFIEVKTRNLPAPPGWGRVAGVERMHVPPHTALTRHKQGRLMRAARHFLAEHDLWHLPCRFDLICILKSPEGRLALEHHVNVLEESRNFVDCGNATWQPW